MASVREIAAEVDHSGGAMRPEQADQADSVVRLTTTFECRWWAPGRIPEAFASWLATLGQVDVATERRDRYLLDEGRPAQNVKVRGGTTCEVKVRTSRDPIDVAGVSGWLERWKKQSVPEFDPVEDTASVEVVKHRLLITIDDGQVELTEASIAGRTWHSLALEADDNPPGSTMLGPVVARLEHAGLGRFMELTADRSHGYGHHLQVVLDGGT